MQGRPHPDGQLSERRRPADANDLATDTDNKWTDGAAVDAHVYTGWTYDYYFKRFSRRGLDNRDRAIVSLVHPAKRQDVLQNFEQFPVFYTNAFYSGDGDHGLRRGTAARLHARRADAGTSSSGALDIVAHELTHGVTDYTSGLIYMNESGALNEAFSDIMGTTVEFFFQQPGSGNLRADYLVGEDVVRPGGIRSMADPQRLRRSRPLLAALHRHRRQRRRAHQLRHRQPGVLPGHRGRHQPHLGAVGAGRRRGQPRADRARVLPRVHADAAGQRDVLRGARGDDPGGARSSSAPTAPPSARSRRRGRR